MVQLLLVQALVARIGVLVQNRNNAGVRVVRPVRLPTTACSAGSADVSGSIIFVPLRPRIRHGAQVHRRTHNPWDVKSWDAES